MLLIYTAHIMDPYTGLDGLRDILIDDNGIIIKVENTSIGLPLARTSKCSTQRA